MVTTIPGAGMLCISPTAADHDPLTIEDEFEVLGSNFKVVMDVWTSKYEDQPNTTPYDYIEFTQLINVRLYSQNDETTPLLTLGFFRDHIISYSPAENLLYYQKHLESPSTPIENSEVVLLTSDTFIVGDEPLTRQSLQLELYIAPSLIGLDHGHAISVAPILECGVRASSFLNPNGQTLVNLNPEAAPIFLNTFHISYAPN